VSVAAQPTRRTELLAIAAELFAARGFHNVTVDDIGAAAGVSGPALYHHFAGKEALLGEMLVTISRALLDGGRAIVATTDPANRAVLDRLIVFHCEFAVDQPALITVQFRDLINARLADQRRVRQIQARYASLWVDQVVAVKSGVDRREARAAVHATFGLINSTPYSATLPRTRMIDLLFDMSSKVLK
jgi:AcrR family transcriptional regulator